MVACERQLLGLALACIAFMGSIISCALPTWRIMTAFKDVKMLMCIAEGLWKRCAILPTGEMHCMGYEYIPLPADMKAARALVIIAIIIEVLGILLGVAGRNFMNFVPDEWQRSKMALTSGIAFLIAGFFVLIPVSWTTNTINDHFHPTQSTYGPDHGVLKKMELGAALYIGWFTTVLLFLGGGLVCSSFFCRNGTE
ncbi:claudin-4-like [Astatotilapia calliptera]|uniref:claudin-4-like n=1 Tax=Astatotilapia calliptera TaxID=8154 RepID=UPI000E425B3C|nr:claudin-4-like [Astatotilapia calliptera]